MKKTNIRHFAALSCWCLLVYVSSVQGQEEGGDDGFSFSDDAFDITAVAAAPPPIYDNFVEGGIGYNREDSYRFGRYSGLMDEGMFVNGGFRYLQRGEWNGDTLEYIEARGEDLGLDSRSLYGEGGVQGKYKLFLHYDETPNNNFEGQTPFLGVGSGSLTLPLNWQSNSLQKFNTASQNFPELGSSLHGVKMQTQRTRNGGGLSWNIDRLWTARLIMEQEKKEGLKPIGVAWGTTGQTSAAVIVPQPIDYRTDRMDAELAYRDRNMQMNFAYQYSQFDNGDSSLLVQNPFTYRGWPSYPNGVAEIDQAPDNSAHLLTLSGGYNFTGTTRLTANLSYSRQQQDQALLGYTANPLLITPQGLPRSSADAKVTGVTGNLELYSRPTKALDYRLRYRYSDRDNDSPRDLYVYVAGDAEHQQIGGSEARYRFNTPYSFTDHVLSGKLGYRLLQNTKLHLGYKYSNTNRTYSERTENDEQTANVGIRHKFNNSLNTSVDYAHTWRDGSSYEGASTLLDSYSSNYVDSLGNEDFINHPQLRMYNLADLERDKASARVTYSTSRDVTLGARLSYQEDDYNASSLGLTAADGWGFSLDGSYRLNDDLTLTGFYAYDKRSMEQAGWSFGTFRQAEQIQDPERRWWVESDYRVYTAGAGLDWRVAPKINLSTNYTYSDTLTDTDIRAASVLEADDFPDVKSRVQSLRSELDYELSKQTTLGFSYIYKRYSSTDWQIDAVLPDTVGRVLSMDLDDPDYENHVVIAWARYRF